MSDAMHPAGWYPDPWYPGGVRWWDGATWTEHAGPGASAAGGQGDWYDAQKGAGSAKWGAIGFIVQGALGALQAFLGPVVMHRIWAQLEAVFDTPTEPHDLSLDGLAMVLQLSSYLALAGLVLVMIWSHRATANARALGLRTSYSPGWTVAGWIIPIANLFMPYQSVRDLFPEGHPARRTAGLWWASYLTGTALAVVASFTAIATGSGPAMVVGAFAAVAIGVGALLAVRLVREATACHERLAAGDWSLPAEAPSPVG